MVPEYPNEQYVRPTNVGLPGDEFTLRKERLNSRLHHTHLEDVYARNSLGMQGPVRCGQLDPWGPNPDLPYRKPMDTADTGKLPTRNCAERTLQESQIANATRRALGHSWYPTDHLGDSLEDYAVPCVSSNWHDVPQRKDPIPDKYLQEYNQLFHGAGGFLRQQEDPIPDKYLQEFNGLWYEDDEDNDADQLLADLTPNEYAPWRTHLPLRPMYGPDIDFRTSTHYRDKTEMTNWTSASYTASVAHQEVVEPEPLDQTEPESFVRWSDSTLAHQGVLQPKPMVRPKPQSFFDWSDSSSQDKSRKKKHSLASIHWKRLTKGFRHSHRA